MVSERYARQQFGEPALRSGRTLRLPNQVVPIVGVLPAAFDFPAATDIWLPTRAGPVADFPTRQQLSRNRAIEARRHVSNRHKPK